MSKNGWHHRLAAGFLPGVLAYGVNYVLIWLYLGIDGATWREVYSHIKVSNPMVKFTGQTLYNAQFVGTRFIGDAGSVEIRNYVTDASFQQNLTSTVPGIIYLVTPILILIVAGYLFSRYLARPSSRQAAVKVGLGIVPGYLLLSIGGMRFFYLIGLYVGSRPDPLPAILVVGLLYPVLWGEIGAIIGYELHTE